jgi:hypothetical protein
VNNPPRARLGPNLIQSTCPVSTARSHLGYMNRTSLQLYQPFCYTSRTLQLALGAYIHSLYGMSDGFAIAFFELQNGFQKTDDGIPKYTKHLALSVDSMEQLKEWQEHIKPALLTTTILQKDTRFSSGGVRARMLWQQRFKVRRHCL